MRSISANCVVIQQEYASTSQRTLSLLQILVQRLTPSFISFHPSNAILENLDIEACIGSVLCIASMLKSSCLSSTTTRCGYVA